MEAATVGADRRPSLARLGQALGFRRVECVRVVVGPHGTDAAVTGVVHRYPRTVAVSLAMAARLVAAGAPLHVRHDRPAEHEHPVEVA